MSETGSTDQKEKTSRIRRKPKQDSLLSPTFAAARHSGNLSSSHAPRPENGLLQRQCACGKHTIAGGTCATCRKNNEASPLQRASIENATENSTGLPDNLQAGLEQLSGVDFSGVRVHNDSSKPAQLNALAYTQGQDIHIGPDQEKHLPHEGWHVAQQMQGRVKPTKQVKGVSINDNRELERESDVMGAQALQMKRPEYATTVSADKGTTLLHSDALRTDHEKNKVTQFVLPAIVAGMGAAEWIAVGALGFAVGNEAVRAASGDVRYKFDEMEGVLLPGGGSDVSAYRTAHPDTTINEATHHVAVWFGYADNRKMGIKFGITFLYDGHAIGNISLSIIEVYDAAGWGGNVDVNMTPRSLGSGGASIRFTINMGTENSWILFKDVAGNIRFNLRSDGDLSMTSTSRPWHQIG